MTGLRPPVKSVVKYSGFLCAWCTPPPCKYDGGLSNPLVAALAEMPTVQHEHVWVLPGSPGPLGEVGALFYCSDYPVLPLAAF